MNWHRFLAKVDEIVTPGAEAIIFLVVLISGLFGWKLVFVISALAYVLGSGTVNRIWGLFRDAQDNG